LERCRKWKATEANFCSRIAGNRALDFRNLALDQVFQIFQTRMLRWLDDILGQSAENSGGYNARAIKPERASQFDISRNLSKPSSFDGPRVVASAILSGLT